MGLLKKSVRGGNNGVGMTKNRVVVAKTLLFQQPHCPYLSRELFAAILERNQRFGVPPPLLRRG